MARPAETQGIEYRVLRERVESLRRRAHHHTVYLCGCAGGEDEFWDLLDWVVILSVDDDTLRYRLATRTSNNFGKAALISSPDRGEVAAFGWSTLLCRHALKSSQRHSPEGAAIDVGLARTDRTLLTP